MGKGKPRKVNRYSNEVKITAIKLAQDIWDSVA
jgi:hypothetical protein